MYGPERTWERILTILPAPSRQNAPSLIKLTNTTPKLEYSPSLAPVAFKYEYRYRSVSQFELAPSTLVSTTNEASGGRPRYGSRSGGMRMDIAKRL